MAVLQQPQRRSVGLPGGLLAAGVMAEHASSRKERRTRSVSGHNGTAHRSRRRVSVSPVRATMHRSRRRYDQGSRRGSTASRGPHQCPQPLFELRRLPPAPGRTGRRHAVRGLHVECASTHPSACKRRATAFSGARLRRSGGRRTGRKDGSRLGRLGRGQARTAIFARHAPTVPIAQPRLLRQA